MIRLTSRPLLVLTFAFAIVEPTLGNAQDAALGSRAAVQLADRGPIFFAALEGRPAAIDVRTTSIFRQRVSLHLANTTVAHALAAVSRQSGLQVIYDKDALPKDARTSINADQLTIASALNEILLDTEMDVEVAGDRFITLVPHGAAGVTNHRRQPGTGIITGRVTDRALKTPLSAATIRVEGTTLGATTGADGKYTIISVPLGAYHLTARRVGYTPLTEAVMIVADSVAAADFALASAPTKLNEVVTTAVGDQRRYEVGNVISTINADSITRTAPLTNLTDLLSARAPGVEVEETSGLTGAGEAIRIRGQGSLILQGDPIVIVDGVRQNNAPGGSIATLFFGNIGMVPSPSRLNDVDFNDIASIDVLKGPSASTEYGTDAANGVVVITTKHGAAGKPHWTFSADQTTSKIPEAFPTLYYSWGHTTDASHKLTQCPLAPYVFSSGYGSGVGTCAVDSVTTWDPLNEPNYSLFGTGSRGKYDLSVSGGSDAVRYFLSGGLTNETGLLQLPPVFQSQAATLGLPPSIHNPNTEQQRTVRGTTVIGLSPRADLTVTGAYLSTYQAVPSAANTFEGVVTSHPFRDSASAYGYDSYHNGFANPIYQLATPNSQNASRLTGGMTGSWHPTLWLTTHGTVGIDHESQSVRSALLPQALSLYAFSPASLELGNSTTDIYTIDLRATTTAEPLHAIRAVTSLGLQMADTRLQGTTAFATGITATNQTLNGATNPTVTQLGSRQATVGGYGEEQLGFADRLFLTGAVRIDAASGFGSAYSTAVYPKASVSWLALNSGATTVRVRGAFGESGVQPPNGAALQLYTPVAEWFNGGPSSTVQIANVQNPHLQPERSAEYEGGVDLGMWQNRVSVEVTGYSKTTHDALVTMGTGWELGNLAYEANVGTVRNVGAEATITAALVQAWALTWDVTVNGSVNHNKLVALGPGIPSQQFFGDHAIFRFKAGTPLYGYWAPRVQYADLNHDGILEPNEVTVGDSLSYVGTSSPTQEASIGTHVGLWGGAVAVGALVDYRGGFRLLNTTTFHELVDAQSDRASNDRKAPFWQQARDVAQEFIYATGLDGYSPANGFQEDGTYIRFRELSLTYAVPYRVVHALRVRSVSITGAVRNLKLWTRYSGTDPEVSNSEGVGNAKFQPSSNTYLINHDIREDAQAVPLARYWVARLNVGF